MLCDLEIVRTGLAQPRKSLREEVIPFDFTQLKDWAPYRKHFTNLQLSNRQVRLELLQAWAEYTVFEIRLRQSYWRRYQVGIPSGLQTRKAKGVMSDERLAHFLWIDFRDCLESCNSRFGVSSNIRRIRVMCEYGLDTRVDHHSGHRLNVLYFRPETIARHLERVDATLAHPELRLDVLLACGHPGYSDYPFVARAMRSFCLRQSPASSGLRTEQDWTLEGENPMMIRVLRHCQVHGNYIDWWETEESSASLLETNRCSWRSRKFPGRCRHCWEPPPAFSRMHV